MENICLDTDVIVDFLRNKKDAILFIETNELINNLATTQINLFELYYGAAKSERSEENTIAVDKIKEKITILNLSEDSAKTAGKILAELERRGETIDFRDLLIGTVALCNGYKIKTKNIKHFNKIKRLEIVEK